MRCMDRMGREQKTGGSQQKMLDLLYGTVPGRALLRLLIQPKISEAAGRFLDSRASRMLIAPFIRRNQIDLAEYEEQEYASYNAFFTRKIRPECRAFEQEADILMSPCDSRLSVYPIDGKARFSIKHTEYTMESLVRSRKLAKRYEGGCLLVFRLSVEDYHRYCYVDDGRKTKNYRIKGVFHTVNPRANDVYPIYKENTREFSVLKSKNFGNILMMEVGALLVGRIVNYHEEKEVKRGEEKGRFEFGGSTVILALEKNKVRLDADLSANSARGIETLVRQGERIGIAENKNSN